MSKPIDETAIVNAIDHNCGCLYSAENILECQCEPHAIMAGNRGDEAREKFVKGLGFERHERGRWLKSEFGIDQQVA